MPREKEWKRKERRKKKIVRKEEKTFEYSPVHAVFLHKKGTCSESLMAMLCLIKI
jgi:hypothetical protein